MDNRYLKFRVWDPDREQMIEDVQTKYWFCEALSGAPEHEEKVIMQYTGLDDAEEMPVYEGDLLWDASMGTPLVVQWWERGAGFRAFDPEAPDGTASYPLAACLSKSGGPQLRVVGNIHENPDWINA